MSASAVRAYNPSTATMNLFTPGYLLENLFWLEVPSQWYNSFKLRAMLARSVIAQLTGRVKSVQKIKDELSLSSYKTVSAWF